MAEKTSKRTPYTIRGREIDHAWLVALWKSGAEAKKHSRARIEACRDLRRKTRTVQLAQTWVTQHPEAAGWVTHVMPERRTLERDLKARVGSVKPALSRMALGDLDTDVTLAERCERYMDEWKRLHVPVETFSGKGVEDGEYALVVTPADLDLDGQPDFFEYLDERAYQAMQEAERGEYEQDRTDRRKRYAKKGKDGKKVPSQTWDRDEKGRSRERHEAEMRRMREKRNVSSMMMHDDEMHHDEPFRRDPKRSEDAHTEAVETWRRNYLLDKPASTVRVVPALDCAPFFTRGKGSQRWTLTALVERALFYPEELPASFGWRGMGDRHLIPQGYDSSRASGQDGQWYLYTAYFTWVDDDGIERPILAYSVGGLETCWGDEEPEQDEPDTVAVIDLYEEYGITGPLWSYHGGAHTDDDDPDFYWEPYLWAYKEAIEGIEGITTAIKAATAVSAFTGHYQKPDPALLAADSQLAESIIDSKTGMMRAPQVPAAGEVLYSVSDIVPAEQATVSADAWRVQQFEMLSLRENTAFEQSGGSGSSGHALLVADTLAKVAQRYVREGTLEATVSAAEKHLRILHAYEQKHKIRWPISTTKERPVGAGVTNAEDVDVFDPAWVVKDNKANYRLTAHYPEEENLARIDLARAMFKEGTGSFEDLVAAQGKSDPETEWAKVLKDRIRQEPSYIQEQVTRLAKQRGNRVMLEILKLQADMEMTKAGLPAPGMEAGLPTTMLKRAGEQAQTGGGGGPTMASSARGGIEAGQMGVASRQADAMAQIQGGQGAA
jgi:hypothetical protein